MGILKKLGNNNLKQKPIGKSTNEGIAETEPAATVNQFVVGLQFEFVPQQGSAGETRLDWMEVMSHSVEVSVDASGRNEQHHKTESLNGRYDAYKQPFDHRCTIQVEIGDKDDVEDQIQGQIVEGGV